VTKSADLKERKTFINIDLVFLQKFPIFHIVKILFLRIKKVLLVLKFGNGCSEAVVDTTPKADYDQSWQNGPQHCTDVNGDYFEESK